MRMIQIARVRASLLPLLFVALFVLPFMVRAQGVQSQETQAILRDQIRSAILSDPRSAELSQQELATIVAALAGKVIAQGDAADYLPPPTTFTPSSSDGVIQFAGYPLSIAALYGIVLFSLAIAMISLKKFFHLHGGDHGGMAGMPPAAA